MVALEINNLEKTKLKCVRKHFGSKVNRHVVNVR